MCGIAGILEGQGKYSVEEKSGMLISMASKLAHRGPDGSGTWVDEQGVFGVAHRRLSVVDISETGSQPMISHSRRYVLAFNGEIYNHRAIRAELERAGIIFRGASDTEVFLASIEIKGLATTLQAVVGMFAFGLWDTKEKRLTLGRDRLGEKPLYYGIHKSSLVFASELSAFSVLPGWNAELDDRVISLYLKYNYVPGPWSIYSSIYKLMPGTTLAVTPDDLQRGMKISPWPEDGTWNVRSPEAYWSPAAGDIGAGGPSVLENERCLVDELDRLLFQSIEEQMIADVPVGAMLSGGIDSSTVVAIMQRASNRPVHTFSIGFQDPRYDEAKSASKIAKYLGTMHTEMYVSAQEAMDVIPTMSEVYDEPFADMSQIPTYIVSRLARGSVTVTLSGDGGDELFGGYNRYLWSRRIWSLTGWVPIKMRPQLARLLHSRRPDQWDKLFLFLERFVTAKLAQRHFGDKLHKVASVLRYRTQDELYDLIVSCWREVPTNRCIGERLETALDKAKQGGQSVGFEQRMMLWDLMTYLPDDILVKTDRASMAVGLENRVPMLDHRIVQFSRQLPIDMKIRNGTGKWILRQVLDRYVPAELVNRPKTGFVPPVGDWLRGPLSTWCEELLEPQALESTGVLDPFKVRKLWLEHKKGDRNWQYQLWNVLMLQNWLHAGRSRI